jgi:hypothetical protein
MSNSANFMAARFAGSFEMWSPDRLVIETITKRLGGDSWQLVVSSRDGRYEEISAIVEDTQEKIIEAFRSGALIAYVHRIETGLFYVVPAQVWDGFDAMGYLDGRLYLGVMDTAYHRSIPDQFLDTALMVVGDEARAWIKGAAAAPLLAELPKPVPGGLLDKWFDGLSDEELGFTNERFLQLAREAFPTYYVARDRPLDIRRHRVGKRAAGRPKTNGE